MNVIYEWLQSLKVNHLILITYRNMSYSNSGYRQENSRQKEKPSRVLLVCVYDTVILDITNQAIYDRFNKFGNIIKILVFQRGEVTKFFIQFSEIGMAENAKKSLDGAKLYQSICKMNIYFSNFNNVDLRHQSSQGADFVMRQEMKNYFTSTYDMLSKQSDNFDFINDEALMYTFDPFHPYSRSKTDDPKLLQQILKKNNTRTEPRQLKMEQQIQQNINGILDSREESKGKSSGNNSFASSSVVMKSVKIKEEASIRNSFLAFEISGDDIPIRNIYNIFSNFGNVSFINKTRKTIYIKFRTIQFAAIASNYLQGTVLMRNLLALKNITDQKEGYPKENEYCQCTYYDQSFDRFTPQKSITINPPSRTLHVSSIKKEACKVDNLRRVFGDFGQVEAVQILQHSSQKNMALIKFYSIEDSFCAISQLHNRSIAGRKIQISFTKSKLI